MYTKLSSNSLKLIKISDPQYEYFKDVLLYISRWGRAFHLLPTFIIKMFFFQLLECLKVEYILFEFKE